MSSVKDRGAIHLGLDVHKNSISAGVLEAWQVTPRVDRIVSDEEVGAPADLPVRESVGSLRVCYEAGPTGYELARLLQSRWGCIAR